MSQIKANGLSLHVEQLDPTDPIRCTNWPGPGPAPVQTVVLIHGLALENLATWYLTIAGPLAEAGLRVITYDLRGHGRSERPRTGYSLDCHVNDLEALLAALAVDGPVHLIGNSYGGTIAWAYALRHPKRVVGVAAIESVPMTQRWAYKLAGKLTLPTETGRKSARSVAKYSFGLEPTPRAVRAAQQIMDETTLGQDVLTSRVSAESEFAQLDLPVMCIYGGDSDVSKLTQYVARMFLRARTVILPGQGHSLLVDDTASVRNLLICWLRQDCGLPVRSPAQPLLSADPAATPVASARQTQRLCPGPGHQRGANCRWTSGDVI